MIRTRSSRIKDLAIPKPLSSDSLRAYPSVQRISLEDYCASDFARQCDDETWRQCVQESYKDDAYLVAPWKDWKDYLDISDYGDMTSVSACNLRNQPHALFHHSHLLGENDPVIGRRLWEGIYSALQLASRLLVSAPVIGFFRLLKYGNEVTDIASPYKTLDSSGVEDYPGAGGDVHDDLMRLSSKLVLLFGAMKSDASNKNQRHAIFTVECKDISKYVYIRCNLPPNPHEFHYIVINKIYGHCLKTSQRRTSLRDQRTQWSLAITLIHELAHAYYALTKWTGSDDYLEPRYSRAVCFLTLSPS